MTNTSGLSEGPTGGKSGSSGGRGEYGGFDQWVVATRGSFQWIVVDGEGTGVLGVVVVDREDTGVRPVIALAGEGTGSPTSGSGGRGGNRGSQQGVVTGQGGDRGCPTSESRCVTWSSTNRYNYSGSTGTRRRPS